MLRMHMRTLMPGCVCGNLTSLVSSASPCFDFMRHIAEKVMQVYRYKFQAKNLPHLCLGDTMPAPSLSAYPRIVRSQVCGSIFVTLSAVDAPYRLGSLLSPGFRNFSGLPEMPSIGGLNYRR